MLGNTTTTVEEVLGLRWTHWACKARSDSLKLSNPIHPKRKGLKLLSRIRVREIRIKKRRMIKHHMVH